MNETPPAVPKMEGARVALRPIGVAEYEQLREIELGALGPAWRHRGATPGPEAWGAAFFDGVLAQFLVVSRRSQTAHGLVTAYHPDHANGHVSLAAARFDPSDRSPSMIEGAVLFLDYVFGCWPFRKVYLQVDEFNLEQFGDGLRAVAEMEGRFVGHTWMGGRYWDRLTYAITRARWTGRHVPNQAAFLGEVFSLDALLGEVATRITGRPVSPEHALVDDLGFGADEMHRLYEILDELVPGYELPEQLDLADVRLRDVHHYVAVAMAHPPEAP